MAHTRRYATLFEKLGARVYKRIYPRISAHTFPPDFVLSLPGWGNVILNPDAPVPPGSQ